MCRPIRAASANKTRDDKTHDDQGENFDTMSFSLDMVRRQFDDLPIAAHLYVTDRCNLSCAYCTEYDNGQEHPAIEKLKAYVDKIAELGCLRIGLQGGEPLLHPDIVELVRHCKSRGLRTSMATNGFHLTAALAAQLRAAGLDAISISIDAITPGPSTQKSLKSVAKKLDILKESGIPFNVAGVLFEQTVDEARQLIDYCVERDIPIHSRVVHAGVTGKFAVKRGKTDRVAAALDYQEQLKRQGKKIKSAHLIDYQRSLLRGESYDWECVAGYKYFFVSAKGEFWQCSMNRTPAINILDVTPELLRSFKGPKPCQDGCGVYCIVGLSIGRQHPVQYAMKEAQGMPRRLAASAMARLKPAEPAAEPTTKASA